MSVGPARFVRWVGADESPGEVVNEAKARTWEHEAEHALLSLEPGGLSLVRGGRDGIEFEIAEGGMALQMVVEGRVVRVAQIHWHTHPRVTGPSDGDLNALTILGQEESWIFELGGDRDGTRIRPKERPTPS